MKSTKKLTVSALYIAMFIVVLGITAGFSFGAVQIRIVNTLYALSYLYPFLIIPAGISVVISNLLFGGLGIIDILGGFFVAVITTMLISSIKTFKLPKILIILPTLLIPAILVPLWLSPILGIPYSALAVSIGIGHVLPAILGYVFVNILEKVIK